MFSTNHVGEKLQGAKLQYVGTVFTCWERPVISHTGTRAFSRVCEHARGGGATICNYAGKAPAPPILDPLHPLTDGGPSPTCTRIDRHNDFPWCGVQCFSAALGLSEDINR